MKINDVQKLLLAVLTLSLFTVCKSIEIPEIEEPVPDVAPAERREAYDRVSSYIASGQPENALKEYEGLSTGDTSSRILLARMMLLSGRREDSRWELGRILTEDPENPEALFTLALLEEISGNSEQASQIVEQVLKGDESHTEAMTLRGRLLFQSESYDSARADFNQALATDEQNFSALLGIGNILFEQEKYEQALVFVNRAIRSDPGSSFAYSDRARIKSALDDPKGALADLDEAITLDSGYYWNYIDRGRLFLRFRQQERAGADFSEAILLDPDRFIAYAYRAGINDELRRYQEAIADYERLIELKKNYYLAFLPLAGLYDCSQDWSGAYDMFRKAYEYDDIQYSYALLAGLALKQDGRQDQAKAYLLKTAEKLPRESWYYLIAQYLLDPGREMFTLHRINQEKDEPTQQQMLFFLAAQFMIEGRTNAGLKYLLELGEDGRPRSVESRIATRLVRQFGL